MTPRTPPPTPAVLLVEDDPASRAFLAAATAALPARVVEADGCRAALEAAASAPPFDLWLVDANLGDGDGAALLAQLRARYPGTPALAHTASNDPGVLDALVAAGFDAAVSKPLLAAALREALRGLLGDVRGDWDDASALDALNGNPGHVQGLRELFLGELREQGETVAHALACGDHATAGAVLHRLRASCGFVGAARLGDAVRMLEEARDDAGALARFQQAVEALL